MELHLPGAGKKMTLPEEALYKIYCTAGESLLQPDQKKSCDTEQTLILQ